jgi:uracil-DNA glycosylase family 4
VARTKVRRFRDFPYWGRPVPGYGDPQARLLVLGLAPAAHGGNRTGRVFTGDRSGDFLFAALHASGFASQPTSVRRDDGLSLRDCYVTAAVRCAPPANRPLAQEFAACRPYLLEELSLLPRLRVVVALGGVAFGAYLGARRAMGQPVPRPLPRFGHGRVAVMPGDAVALIGSYHPSQQNTFTGRLTRRMFAGVLRRAREYLEG